MCTHKLSFKISLRKTHICNVVVLPPINTFSLSLFHYFLIRIFPLHFIVKQLKMAQVKSSESSKVKIKSSDGEVFSVDKAIAIMCITLKDMFESLGDFDGDKDDPIPLNVKSDILKKVIAWATYHKDDPPQTIEDNNNDEYKEKRTDDISTWDADFLKVIIQF